MRVVCARVCAGARWCIWVYAQGFAQKSRGVLGCAWVYAGVRRCAWESRSVPVLSGNFRNSKIPHEM